MSVTFQRGVVASAGFVLLVTLILGFAYSQTARSCEHEFGGYDDVTSCCMPDHGENCDDEDLG